MVKEPYVAISISRPHPSDRRRGRDELQIQPGKPPHEHNQVKSMLELKLTSIHRCRMNQHSAEATHIHFQHPHVHHDYSIDIKYIIAEMKYRQQTYLLVKNSPATSYVAATFHPTIG